jgi:hypothetical protein
MTESVAGLLRDKTRPSRIPPLSKDKIDEVVALTLKPPPHEASHWTVRAMARTVGLSASTVREIWKSHGLSPHRWWQFKLLNDPAFAKKTARSGSALCSSPGPCCGTFGR